MPEFTPLREELETLAARAPMPDFAELRHRVARRRRRRRAIGVAVLAAVVSGFTLASGLYDIEGMEPAERPSPALAPNGWVAVDVSEGGGDIYLTRPGADPRQLEVAGSDSSDDACPVWSPDGTRLMFGRVAGSSGTASGDAELVIVTVDRDGAAGPPTVIGLDGYRSSRGDPHPCGIWAPGGQWVALAGAGDVWVVDTGTGAVRKLPDLRPSDLEWRPGTDELAIVGDTADAGPPATLVTLYTVSTGEIHQLGAIEATHVTWSPDGTSLAYTSGALRELRLIDGDGTNDRLLVAGLSARIQGVGPVWSPAGDRIAYQRCEGGHECSGLVHDVVLVSVADGSETVIEPPTLDGRSWYPSTVSWSPDGRSLLYAGWNRVGMTERGGVIALPADRPSDAQVLMDSVHVVPWYFNHPWTAIQTWGRQPE